MRLICGRDIILLEAHKDTDERTGSVRWGVMTDSMSRTKSQMHHCSVPRLDRSIRNRTLVTRVNWMYHADESKAQAITAAHAAPHIRALQDMASCGSRSMTSVT